MAYAGYKTWVDDDGSGTVGTPVDAANLQSMEDGIRDAFIQADAAVSGLAGKIGLPGSPSLNDALVWNGSSWISTKVRNAQIASDALIDVAKLSLGTNGFVLTMVAGVPVWATAAGAGYGTSFPGSPTDGQEFVLTDSTTAPKFAWRFRYNASSLSTFKWEAIGALPVVSEVNASDSLPADATLTYRDLTNVGPSVTLPRAGDYIVDIGCDAIPALQSGTSAESPTYMSYDIGGTGAVDADGIHVSYIANAPFTYGSRRRVKTGLAAVTLTAKYKHSLTAAGGTGGTFQNRVMSVMPVRCS